ncbi:MAG: hypothetical protein QOE48_5740 [Mycobacterium sp.]|jgi:hypothetical protein|nr:hypothetical protein [Mycobacterium sp.]MDT5131954.1 hypothetical protein [Mycobacterium sp.]MDT5277977.1 hypothetical protein [Mycobacterium sp.]MDT5310034.1 hypothetical protein [Mycobacterium sp.]
MTDPAPQHPGTIRYLDEAGALVNELPIEEVPAALQFAYDENERLIPVIEVVARDVPGGRELLEYGPGGQLLRVTRQRLG